MADALPFTRVETYKHPPLQVALLAPHGAPSWALWVVAAAHERGCWVGFFKPTLPHPSQPGQLLAELGGVSRPSPLPYSSTGGLNSLGLVRSIQVRQEGWEEESDGNGGV